MLDGIETGYEGKYDFPTRAEAPGLVYVLATVPRKRPALAKAATSWARANAAPSTLPIALARRSE